MKLSAKIERNEQGEVTEVELFPNQITETNVTDAGLVHIKELTNLQTLYITSTQITDAGLVHLKGLTQLQGLALPEQITDAGLVHLKGLTQLQGLALPEQVTDAGLMHLKGLTNLEQLPVDGTKVTAAGIAELMKALPNVNISASAAIIRDLRGLLDDK